MYLPLLDIIQSCTVTRGLIVCLGVSCVLLGGRCVFYDLLLPPVVSLTQQWSRAGVTEAISGHVTARRPMCYQPLADPRSAVWAT